MNPNLENLVMYIRNLIATAWVAFVLAFAGVAVPASADSEIDEGVPSPTVHENAGSSLQGDAAIEVGASESTRGTDERADLDGDAFTVVFE